MLNSHKCTTSIVQFVKAAIIVISVHLKISTLRVVSHVLTIKVSPEWRLNLGLWTQKMWPFPLNRVVHSIEVTDTKITWRFFRDQILCPLKGGVLWLEVSQRRDSAVVNCYSSTESEGPCLPEEASKFQGESFPQFKIKYQLRIKGPKFKC